jgi:hypothetical protein
MPNVAEDRRTTKKIAATRCDLRKKKNQRENLLPIIFCPTTSSLSLSPTFPLD